MTLVHRRRLLTNSLLFGAAFARNLQADEKTAQSDSPAVETQYGKVRGPTVQGVSIFRGVPYGGPTDGSQRFLPPSKPMKWTGVLECRENGPRCVQGRGNIFLSPQIGEYFRGSTGRTDIAQQRDSENCLVLNVLTPGIRGKRPVLVYIHGGGYTGGSGLLTVFADAFPRENDVVLVGVNHRLNVFGYLYLGDLSSKYATGNPGQLDLVAALQWVRDNISNFGGDPNNVTIFGESGGGGKISTLLAMPSANGLFHKAIIESGSVLRASERDQATATAKAVLAKLQISENDVDKLQQVPAADLFTAFSQSGGSSPMRIGPVVDGHSLPQQTWEPKAPATASGIPMIIGCCKDETSLFSLADKQLYDLDQGALHDRIVKAGLPSQDAEKLVAMYRRDHPKDSFSDVWFRFATDRAARANAVKQAELKLAQASGDVYMYYFAWDTPLVEGKIKAFHTAELPLAMRLVRYPESEQLSKHISRAWASFARSGSPNRTGLPEWPRFSADGRATMIFNADASKAVNDPDHDERVFLSRWPQGPPA